ncbi:hypothetical protein [Acetivibrio ethanolgignens]|uniref:Uncharacterized protein n=1 Tax=Acetivibrio ethanolgignens TaxID=290052 RepID=A0A0V8QIR6_9FIRM|nr:hypothetical protein [Acetivibrio ethanolgignens]KSV60291.1 hypothetical protein ASU35_05935 [Acetivibrio ethanolgignens]
MEKTSLLVDDMTHCIYCNRPAEEHHVFFGNPNRAAADRRRLVVPLCSEHHRTGKDAPHKNRIVDMTLKCWAQTVYEEKCGTREDFRREFGKSYL